MSQKLMVQETVFNGTSGERDGWPPEDPAGFLAWFNERIEQIPAEHRAAAKIEFSSDGGYYGEHSAHVEWYCIQRLCNEIDRLRGIVPEVLERLNDELCVENEQLRAALARANRGESICLKCGLRQDGYDAAAHAAAYPGF